MRTMLFLAVVAAALSVAMDARAADMTQKIDLGGKQTAKIPLNHVELQRGGGEDVGGGGGVADDGRDLVAHHRDPEHCRIGDGDLG